MSELFNPLTIPFLLAMFLAINMGASGTGASFSAAYGANVIRRTMIPGLFGIMVLAGALIAGKNVSLTLGDGILAHSFFSPLITSIILFSIGSTLLVANLLAVPQSTVQSTVFSIAGAAVALDNLNTQKLFFEIIPTWVILPIIAFFIMLIFAKWMIPVLRSKVFTEDYSHLNEHPILKYLLIVSAMYVAFSIGANNVANAAAPIASLTANELGQNGTQNITPIIILSVLIVAPCFAIGSSLLGHKVTKAMGKDIVEVNPFYATVISFIVATLLIIVSVVKGIPTSLVQLNSAAFIALSVSKIGFRNTFKNPTVKRFFIVWAVAPTVAFIISYLLVILLK